MWPARARRTESPPERTCPRPPSKHGQPVFVIEILVRKAGCQLREARDLVLDFAELPHLLRVFQLALDARAERPVERLLDRPAAHRRQPLELVGEASLVEVEARFH